MEINCKNRNHIDQTKESNSDEKFETKNNLVANIDESMDKKQNNTRSKEIEKSIVTTYRKTIWNRFIKGIKEFELVKEGDKIAVCISGGKDSMLLAKCFQELKRHREMNFDIEFIVMDPGYNEKNRQKIIDNAKILDIPITIFESDIFDAVDDIGDSPCYMCARMRRGYLYNKAKELGCNKIALGHHFDDVIETVLMGMFYGAQFQTMMPKLHSSNHEGMELIRPLYYVKEDDIIRWKNWNHLEFIQCACRFTELNADEYLGVKSNDYTREEQNADNVILKKENTIVNEYLESKGSNTNNRIKNKKADEYTSKRAEMKALIKHLRAIYPNIDINILRSTENVNLDTIISYRKGKKVWNFMDEY